MTYKDVVFVLSYLMVCALLGWGADQIRDACQCDAARELIERHTHHGEMTCLAKVGPRANKPER